MNKPVQIRLVPLRNKHHDLTVLGDGCGRSLQHVLRQVDEHLVELSSAQQVEILNDLEESTNVSTVCSAATEGSASVPP